MFYWSSTSTIEMDSDLPSAIRTTRENIAKSLNALPAPNRGAVGELYLNDILTLLQRWNEFVHWNPDMVANIIWMAESQPTWSWVSQEVPMDQLVQVLNEKAPQLLIYRKIDSQSREGISYRADLLRYAIEILVWRIIKPFETSGGSPILTHQLVNPHFWNQF